MIYFVHMKNKIITVVALIVLLAVVIYGYEMVFKKPLVESPTNVEDMDTEMMRLDIKEQYDNGMYTFAGTIQTPTPCYEVIAEASVAPTNSEIDQYEINIYVTPPPSDVVCADVISNKDYKVSFEAPKDAEIKAFINGAEYELNRFEVPVGQDIDSFELFIKA